VSNRFRQRRNGVDAARIAALLVVGTTIVACGGDDDAGDAERFCGEIEVHQGALFSPDISSATEIGPLVELYREIGELAPLAIEDEWDQLVLNYETASTVVPGDEASIQAAAAQAYQTEQSAAAVKQWLVDNCALDIGPVATIVAQGG
jgi:hypothetical protein